MNSINGPLDLTSVYEANTTILDINTGLKTEIIIGRKKLDYQRFYICPNIYSLAKEWWIEQPRGQIVLVKDLIDLTDPIHKRYGKIYNKFERLRDFILLDDGNYFCGWPSCNQWIDRDLVISKND